MHTTGRQDSEKQTLLDSKQRWVESVCDSEYTLGDEVRNDED